MLILERRIGITNSDNTSKTFFANTDSLSETTKIDKKLIHRLSTYIK